MIIDLHTHSYYSSDGEYSIKELLDIYPNQDIVGITDHETIGGWGEFVEESNKRGIKPILGVEWFSVKCHILSYFINKIPQGFLNFMSHRRETEKQCMRTVYKKIKIKYPQLPSYQDILDSRPHPESIIGLPALANAISNASGIEVEKAEDLVRKEKRGLPEVERPIPFYPYEIISKINSWNGVPVVAHPYRKGGGELGHHSKDTVEKKVRELHTIGIKGLDVYSWESTMTEYTHLMSLCEELNLLPIIGSDFHSHSKGRCPMDLNNFNANLFGRINKWLMD
jgi:3',5'-nucleoside bisphosphate phosphatase